MVPVGAKNVQYFKLFHDLFESAAAAGELLLSASVVISEFYSVLFRVNLEACDATTALAVRLHVRCGLTMEQDV